MMNKFWGLLVSFVFSVIVSEAMILEAEDTMSLRVEESVHDGRSTLVISGLCGHSSYVVDEVTYQRSGPDLYIAVMVVPASSKKKSSGSFAEKVPDSATVQRVLFGKAKSLVWQRKM